jgi:uncharacterized Tic20 family protein
MASSYTGKPCPKCAHVRSEAETAPDWQCPKCGIVYAKFGQETPARAAAAPAKSEASESPGLAKLAHLATLANYLLPPLGTIVPVAIWVTKSGEDELAVDSAKEAINFQICTVLWALAVFLPAFLIRPLIFITSMMLVVILIAGIALPIVATVRVADGTRYYYPYIWHIFGDGPGE